MVLEWLRRRDPQLDQQLRKYLFIEGSILGKEDALDGAEAAASSDPGEAASDGSLGIGSLRKEVRR